MLTSAIELYADLDAMYTMLALMREHVKIPDFINQDFENLTNKARSTIILLINKYIQNKAEKHGELYDEIKSEVAKYNELINEGDEYFAEDVDELKRRFEDEEDLTRGAYKVLSKVLSLIERYYDVAMSFAKNAFNAKNVSEALNELAEAYAGFSVIQALYAMFCEYWDICYDHLEYGLDNALESTKQVINKIIDYYIKS